MREQLEGSAATARAVAAARPQVVCAYPITPQTHIVEALGRMVKTGALAPCRFVNVESEFAAMSVCIGAAAAGSRSYTATASQGLLYMSEAVHNAAGLGLPIVMTIANRAIGAPINIWNDHGDAMALRDAGWVQLYAAGNQEAVDLHIQAFRIAELLSLPVMVCVDGFTLTHAVEAVDLPDQEDVDRFLPPLAPTVRLDPEAPLTIGAMVGPEAFTEVRYLAHRRMQLALDAIPRTAAEFARVVPRPQPGLLRRYRADDADTIVVAMGSLCGTLEEVVDDLRSQGLRLGLVSLTAYRPFPTAALRAALSPARRVVVFERAFATGGDGFVTTDARPALGDGQELFTVVAGLGGRPVAEAGLAHCLVAACREGLDPVTFLGLDQTMIQPELRALPAFSAQGS